MDIRRFLTFPKDSFFLYGPRGVGKTTWLKEFSSWSLTLNLLHNEDYLKFLSNPSLLRSLAAPLKKGSWIWIDEVQKVPALLDEVHDLIETKKIKFALSGSSARKLKRDGGNLLAGRAITRYMPPFSFVELGKKFDLKFALEFGNLPLVVTKPELSKDILNAYVSSYLKEEIQQEGHVRKFEPFVRFMEVSALMNGHQVNANNLSRDAKVSRPSINGYFSILVDTLLGHWLPAYQPKLKVREQAHPKFYWFDPGVARAAARLLDDPVDSEWLGTALETLIFHELRVRNLIINQDRRISYYRLQSGLEIDFVIETRRGTPSRVAEVVLIEVKNSTNWDSRWSKPLNDFADSKKISVRKKFGVYRGKHPMNVGGVLVLPVVQFLEALHSGEVF